jgi:hypothetical protein
MLKALQRLKGRKVEGMLDILGIRRNGERKCGWAVKASAGRDAIGNAEVGGHFGSEIGRGVGTKGVLGGERQDAVWV